MDDLPLETQRDLSLTIDERPDETIIRVRGRSPLFVFISTLCVAVVVMGFVVPIASIWRPTLVPNWVFAACGGATLVLATGLAARRALDPVQGGRIVTINRTRGWVSVVSSPRDADAVRIPLEAVVSVGVSVRAQHDSYAEHEGQKMYIGSAATLAVELTWYENQKTRSETVLITSRRRDADAFTQWFASRVGQTTRTQAS